MTPELADLTLTTGTQALIIGALGAIGSAFALASYRWSKRFIKLFKAIMPDGKACISDRMDAVEALLHKGQDRFDDIDKALSKVTQQSAETTVKMVEVKEDLIHYRESENYWAQ